MAAERTLTKDLLKTAKQSILSYVKIPRGYGTEIGCRADSDPHTSN